MNCYRCLVGSENRVCAAVAVCQRCGSGMCARHLMTLTRPATTGMNAAMTPSLVCSHCFQALFPAAQARKHERTRKSRSWIERLSRRGKQHDNAEQALPAPAEAVELIERFLRQQKT